MVFVFSVVWLFSGLVVWLFGYLTYNRITV